MASNPSKVHTFFTPTPTLEKSRTNVEILLKKFFERNFSIQQIELLSLLETAHDAQTVFLSVCGSYNTYTRCTTVGQQGGVFKSLQWPYLVTTTPTFEKSRKKLRFSVEAIIRKEIFQFSSLNFSFFLKLPLTRRLSSLAFVACIIHIFVALQLG